MSEDKNKLYLTLIKNMNVYGAIEQHLVALDKLFGGVCGVGCGNWQHCCWPLPALAEQPSLHLRTKIAYSLYVRLGNQISLKQHSRAQKWLLMRLTECMEHIITDNGAMLVWPLDHSSTCCRRLTREVNHHSDRTRLTQQQNSNIYTAQELQFLPCFRWQYVYIHTGMYLHSDLSWMVLRWVFFTLDSPEINVCPQKWSLVSVCTWTVVHIECISGCSWWARRSLQC